MSDLFAELQEDMSQARWAELWKKHGNFIIGLCLAVVLGTAAGVGWKQWRQGVHAEQTGALHRGLKSASQEEYAQAQQELSSLEGQRGGVARIATSVRASVAVAQKQWPQAQALFESLAETSDEFARAYGRVMSAYARMEQDEATASVLEAPDADAPLRASTLEMRGWQLLQAGEKEKARAAFAAIKDDPSAPSSMRERARTVWGYVGAQE